MPKNKISDPITDQEIAFARLWVSVRNSPLEQVGIVCFKCPLIFSGHLLRVL